MVSVSGQRNIGFFNLNALLPSMIFKNNTPAEDKNALERVQSLGKRYEFFLGKSTFALIGEYKVWSEQWANKRTEKSIPKSAVEVLSNCDEYIFPLIKNLLCILATLPVSNATAERSFSTLRRLKTWLRTTMGEERLIGLALLHVHFDSEIDIEKIIERFAKKRKRRIDFVI